MKTGRPRHILHNNLHRHYQEYIIGKMPNGTMVPRHDPITNMVTHRLAAVTPPQQVSLTKRDMVKDYLAGKPSSLDTSKYVIMNGKVVPLGSTTHTYIPVDNGYELIPKDYYDATKDANYASNPETPQGPKLVNINQHHVYSIGSNGPVEVMDQRLMAYNGSIGSDIVAPLTFLRARGLNKTMVDEILQTPTDSYRLDKSEFPKYKELFDKLTQSRGLVVLDLTGSPSFGAWAALTNSFQNSMNNTFQCVDRRSVLQNNIKRIGGAPSNVTFVDSWAGKTPQYSSYFLDGTLLTNYDLYERLVHIWPVINSTDRKNIIVASRFRLGNDIKDFFRIMGFTVFSAIFDDAANKARSPEEDVRELYEDAIHGHTVNLKIRTEPSSTNAPEIKVKEHDVKQTTKKPGASNLKPEAEEELEPVSEAHAKAEAEAKKKAEELPVAHAEPTGKLLRLVYRNLKIGFKGLDITIDPKTNIGVAKGANPKDLHPGTFVIIVSAIDNVIVKYENNIPVYSITEIGNDMYKLVGFSKVTKPVEMDKFYLSRVEYVGQKYGAAHTPGVFYTPADIVGFCNQNKEAYITNVWNDYINNKYDYKTPKDFFDSYNKKYEKARGEIRIIVAKDNNFKGGLGLTFNHRMQARAIRSLHGGALDKYTGMTFKAFNNARITLLPSMTFINGYPVYITEFT